MDRIRFLTLRFDNEISPHEIPLFRGAVNAALAEEHSCLFHNHTNDGYRYSYPLIQYKRINKRAAIVCLQEGVEAIGQFFGAETSPLLIGDRLVDLTLESVRPEKMLVQAWSSPFEYRIRDWLPLNSKNYAEYKEKPGLADRITMLEKIMIGNILSFLKGIGIHTDKQITCSITRLDEPRIVKFKGVKMMAFDAHFTTNVSLPAYIGLGKDASTGFGVVTRIKNQNKDSRTQDDG